MKKAGSSPVGMYSTKNNPMSKPNMTSTGFGPSANPDCTKANKLLQKAYKQNDSLRGTGGRM